ncbi:MAG: type II secretion system F family protein, partial [Halobacteriales archaeon]
PLLLAVLLMVPVVLSRYHAGIDRHTKQVALGVFGAYAQRLGRDRERRESILDAAHFPTTFRVYSARTLLYSALLAVAGSIFGVYLLWGVFATQGVVDQADVAAALPESLSVLAQLFVLPELSPGQLFAILLLSSATVGVMLGLSTYALRWWWPAHVAANRRRRIDASLPATISFVYALSRSGMSFPRVMETLAANRAVYGDPADEVGVAVREMDLMGHDVVTAVQSLSERTPSEQYKEFAANLASVLQSGRSLSQFLRDQYEGYTEEAVAQQEQLLELLATLAEVYVTGLVAGPLFLITILVVMGLTLSGTLDLLRVISYGIIPLANMGFILYLTTITESLQATRERIDIRDPQGGIANVRRIDDEERSAARPDGGHPDAPVHPDVERLERYDALRGIRETMTRPGRVLMQDPTAILWVTVPVALVYVVLSLPAAVTLDPFVVDVLMLDDIIVRATLFVSGTFAVVYHAHIRRIRRIEAILPDFLDRLASINEAGMTIVESLGRVRRGDIGALDEEIDRIWADIEWGADVESALYRFERRVRTTVVTRMVALLNNAMSSSGDLADVLRIAAEQAKNDRRLARQRRQEMVTYLMVIYVSFFVFLVIVVALDQVLIPALPTESLGAQSGAAGGSALSVLGSVDPDAYTLVFFHTVLIQGTFSGFVAGQMGGGNPKHGAKHASILLFLAYAAFLVLP